MDFILAFFSGLVTITFGLVVLLLWIVLFGAISIEVFDLVTGADKKKLEKEEEDDRE